MDEYIKRGEIRRAYEKLARSYMHGEPYIADWKFDEMIEELPAADVVPVRHGRWNDWEVFWKECSYCRYRTQKINAREYFFCPKCGAKMDLE